MKHWQFLQDILNGQSLVTPRDIIQGLLAHGEEYEIIADMIEAIYMDEDRPVSTDIVLHNLYESVDNARRLQ